MTVSGPSIIGGDTAGIAPATSVGIRRPQPGQVAPSGFRPRVDAPQTTFTSPISAGAPGAPRGVSGRTVVDANGTPRTAGAQRLNPAAAGAKDDRDVVGFLGGLNDDFGLFRSRVPNPSFGGISDRPGAINLKEDASNFKAMQDAIASGKGGRYQWRDNGDGTGAFKFSAYGPDGKVQGDHDPKDAANDPACRTENPAAGDKDNDADAIARRGTVTNGDNDDAVVRRGETTGGEDDAVARRGETAGGEDEAVARRGETAAPEKVASTVKPEKPADDEAPPEPPKEEQAAV